MYQDWHFDDKASELYAFLFLKLGAKLGGKVKVATGNVQNGFEFWRQLHKEVDPAYPEESRAIITRMRELFTGPAKDTSTLWALILA